MWVCVCVCDTVSFSGHQLLHTWMCLLTIWMTLDLQTVVCSVKKPCGIIHNIGGLPTNVWPSREPRRDQEQGGGAGLRKLDLSFCFSCSSTAVLRTLSLWLCSTQQLKQDLHRTLVATQWWGPHCLNIVVLVVVHGLLGLLCQSAWLGHPLPPAPIPIPNKAPCCCGRKATCLLTMCSHINQKTTYTDPRLAFAEEVKNSAMDFRQKFDASSTALQILHGRDLSGKHVIITGANSGIGEGSHCFLFVCLFVVVFVWFGFCFFGGGGGLLF